MIISLLKAVTVVLIIVGESEALDGLLFHFNKCPAIEAEPWSYSGERNGPTFWGMTYSNCSGYSQSPVDIDLDDVVVDENLPKLELINYDQPITKATIQNNGHTIQVTPEDGVQRNITVEGDSTYSLQQLHFHWGCNYSSGSEHAIDGKYYALEMHLVHSNTRNEIAVVGILFEEADTNDELQKIVDDLPEVKYKDMKKELGSDLNLNNLLPANPISFYRYSGSLTTPACTEGVTWSVSKDLVTVGKSQMEVFRKQLFATKKKDAKGSSSCKLSYNYRPDQPLNKRKIYKSK